MNQEMRVLEYMKQHGGITQLEATNNLGVLRLSARIKDLKEAGHNIVSEFEEAPNRYGEKTRFKRYRVVME